MRISPTSLGAVALASFLAIDAHATVLTTSFATFAANAGPGVVNTAITGQYTPSDPFATVSTINLVQGRAALSDTGTVVVRAQEGFPYALANGFNGDLFLPTGNSLTITPAAGTSAFGFYVATYSGGPSVPAGGYSITVTTSSGLTQTQTSAGASFSTFVDPVQFFGYYGGGVTSLTISDTDPQGFAVGDFFSVPEPASVTLLLVGGLWTIVRGRRKIA